MYNIGLDEVIWHGFMLTVIDIYLLADNFVFLIMYSVLLAQLLDRLFSIIKRFLTRPYHIRV